MESPTWRAASISPMPTSVVTGGAGFLGSHLCDALLERGHRVICVDNLETGSLHNVEHHRIAKRNPRIDMFLWFLLRDERRLTDEGWQSGLLTAGGLKKPSFAAFQRLR